MERDEEAQAQDAFRRISGPERLEGGTKSRRAPQGSHGTLHNFAGEIPPSGLVALYLFLNGRFLWNGTYTVGDPARRFIRIALPDFGNELDNIAAAALSETEIQPLLRE